MRKKSQGAKPAHRRFYMNCKPCGIAIRGEKPKDNRTIWDFGRRGAMLVEIKKRPNDQTVQFHLEH